jgi:apolipoprotein N-acyltransferase
VWWALSLLVPPLGELWAHRMAFAWCLLSAVLWRLCYAPFGWWPLAFVALVPWLWGLRRTTTKGAFWISWFLGTVFFLLVFWWLGSLARFNPFIWLGIPAVAAFQGLFVAFAGAGIVHAARRLPPSVAFVFGALWWTGLEWWRSVGPMGDPFALLGHGVAGFDMLVQTASLGGVFLLSALVFAINLTIMESIASARLRLLDPGVMIRGAVSVALVVWACVWGSGVLAQVDAIDEEGIPVRVALLQPNIDQEMKFESYTTEDSTIRDSITLGMFAMIDALEPGSVELVVTPESAFTVYDFDRNPDIQRELRERADRLGATLIIGANDGIFKRDDGSYTEDRNEARVIEERYLDYHEFNGFFVFRPGETELKTRADFQKVHLMPFGETVPYLWVIPGLQEHIVQVGNLARGDLRQGSLFFPVPMDRADPNTGFHQVQIGPSICFEDMFAYLHRRWNRRGAQLHVNITNNGWFEPSIGSQLHHDFARFRAPETRTPMLFATNTGITAAVDAGGRLIDRLERLEQGTLLTTVHVPREPRVTWYSRLGDLIGWIGFFGCAVVLCLMLIREGREGDQTID